jgi:hypothetical protein
MKHSLVSTCRFWVLGTALLILVSCGQSVAVGERFTLWEGETVRMRGRFFGGGQVWMRDRPVSILRGRDRFGRLRPDEYPFHRASPYPPGVSALESKEQPP